MILQKILATNRNSLLARFIIAECLFHLGSFQEAIKAFDIVLINESQFYVTNDHGFNKPFLKLFEDYLQMSKSNILFYNGLDFIEVVTDLQMANGINISRDKKTVYCAETIGQKLNVYRRNQLDNSLSLVESIELDSGLDNIEIDLNEKISSFSIGQRQQIELLRLLYNGVKIIILDEPTSAFSLEQKKMIFDIFGIKQNIVSKILATMISI